LVKWVRKRCLNVWRTLDIERHNSSRWLFGSGELKWFKKIGHFLFPLSSKMLYINYVLCWRYIIHVLSILCWHVFCFPKKACFIYIKLFSLIQKHSSITLTLGCLCGKGMPFWRIKGVPFMRCISTHKWIWSRLCGRRVMRRHKAGPALKTEKN